VTEVFVKLQQPGGGVNDSIPSFNHVDRDRVDKNATQQPNMQLVTTIAKNLGI
jgi:hypothetical protein